MTATPGHPRPITETEDLRIALSDGCHLSARLWMPKDAASDPVPVILEYIPYRKRDGTAARDALMHPYFAAHGYAAVRVDIRGSGDSDGLLEDEYSAQELSDACEVIAWLAAQPWCSGSVGMMGKSWGGFNCLQTAALRPPALKAVVTVCSAADRFADDIHYKGGCLLGENFGWGTLMLSYMARPPDPTLRPDWREEWLKRLDGLEYLAPRWTEHQARDDYWKHGSVCEDYAAIAAPVLAFGGWADNYMNTVPKLVGNLSVPCKGIIGPWGHQYAHTAEPGPQIGFLQEALRWWDRWLKDVPNGAENDPDMRSYMLDSAAPDACTPHRAGHWVATPDWRNRPQKTTRLHLTDAGLGDEAAPLSATVQTPQHLGLFAGEFFPLGQNAELPGDQAPDDALSTCFDGAPLDAPMALLGAADLHLRLTSDAPRAHLVARLCDVAPDGSSVRIAHGMMNLCHRDDTSAPADVPTDGPFDVVLRLDHMAYRLAAGHQLRIALSTTYWPFIWPTPTATRLTLHSGHLALPLHSGGTDDEWQFPAPESAAPWRFRQHSPADASRRIDHDLITGQRSLIVTEDSGDAEDLDHGLISGETSTERWTITPDAPLSAKAEITWEQRLSRGDWGVRIQVEAQMQADGDTFSLKARLRAFENEQEIYARDYDEPVPRRHG
ncbi:CocE/NonD family hydrolase [Pseudooceanicola algae]|uniref:Xaa-Pro dipeptidyl-peptidase C-terminal domain-containing protein n=1 Tax=Pseudooceanicola algae TaxID=1537215 RepID=A0A418SD45_9RHOB|nr:CocE/NonD family hydrolase [Pseudooceanicola algae]QPM92372.1 hypothetical protein PSAL_036360 [Pseudooceanicola algae]